MTIYEAALTVLKDSGCKMHVKEIYAEILNKELFKFGAKDPVSVLSGTLTKNMRAKKDPRLISLGAGNYKYSIE